ncbi:ABC transporter substrate-binding protein [Cronobacter turicensis]|uniref:ABC transporter substrate-binding protein n=1 Tax=Cronobacter turicensis TaxID=413502 RepID=UPI001DA9A704|nr:ABC transporter substrate-binding protein [Cronobacter turicensis]EGT4493880.1 ABC transporter substrate-binding protein [Cronobacter turicensis]EKM0439829.1 ABC transporter substrate-binding protein [Cronobacter turicensis]ELY4323497.1 ABC transporter substrate-binding protein [Cronobacter turicensis]ELY5944803.1 ABC transporter substrate-binding protein [Cronobacter turicensis]ELY5965867.1 ABC transporter substrate-binding protein [Cronobacter turicensis]
MKTPLLLCFSLLTALPAIAADFPVTVESCGQTLTFTQAPARAVINDINMAEMAFALNLQDRIVGLTGITGWYKLTPDFRQAMGTIPELAPKYPSLETLVAVRPDFFFAGWNYGMKVGGDVTPQTLAPFGIRTFVLSESCAQVNEKPARATMDLLYHDELALGKIFGKRLEAQALVASWKQRLSKVPTRPAGQKPLKVFVYDSGEDKPFTSGRYAMPAAIIAAAGGVNALDTLSASWTTTSWETVAASAPDFIILLDYQNGAGADALRRFLEGHPLMKNTPAVRQHRYLKLQYAELTPGPANIHAVEKLAQAMYGAEGV